MKIWANIAVGILNLVFENCLVCRFIEQFVSSDVKTTFISKSAVTTEEKHLINGCKWGKSVTKRLLKMLFREHEDLIGVG